MTTSQEWLEKRDFIPAEFVGIPLLRGLDRHEQIDRVVKTQGLTRKEAAEQLDERIYDARLYLRKRMAR